MLYLSFRLKKEIGCVCCPPVGVSSSGFSYTEYFGAQEVVIFFWIIYLII